MTTPNGNVYDALIRALAALDVDACVGTDDSGVFCSVTPKLRVYHPAFSDTRSWEILAGRTGLDSYPRNTHPAELARLIAL